MSGPVRAEDALPVEQEPVAAGHVTLEVTPAREAQVGGIRVRRSLPRRSRRTVGAWCFADHLGPVSVTEDQSVDIAPHPHIGLQTVTWLLAGELLHRDSLGSEQIIRPGQLNLMTAGRGVSHSEEAPGRLRHQELHGIQLWVAQPDATRNGPAAFEHHAQLPQLELDGAVATVLVGDFDGARSPARRDTEHVGVDLALRSGPTVLPLHPGFEYALVVLHGSVTVGTGAVEPGGAGTVEPGQLGYLGDGRDQVTLSAGTPARLLLLGGVPFGEPVLMWWNFVARTREEIDRAYEHWQSKDERFGSVGSPLPRIPAPVPMWRTGGPG
jgi:redox-sensitive bicupin YhaK (pirin superfamily)